MARRSGSTASRKPRRKVAGPSPAALAAALVEAVAPDLASADPLQAQLAASYVAADGIEAYWDAVAGAEDEGAADAVPRPVIGPLRLLAELREPQLRDAALALVAGLASLDPADDAVQGAATEAAKRLRFLGAKPPSWAEAIREPELSGIWVVRDVFSESMTYYLGTRWPDGAGAAHCVAARVAYGSYPELVDVFVAEGPEVLVPEVERALADDAEASLLRLDQPEPAAAAALLWEAIMAVEESGGEDLDDDGFDLFALLEARLSLLDDVLESASEAQLADTPHASELDALTEAERLERFLASDAYTSTDGTHQEVAGAIVAWVSGAVSGGVARISPSLLIELLSVLAAAPDDDAQRAQLIEHGIPTTRAWGRLCAALTDLPQDARDLLEQTLDGAADDFEHLVRHGVPPSSGLNDRIFELMLEDGVDVGDQAELDAWSEQWNALTDEQRIARMDA